MIQLYERSSRHISNSNIHTFSQCELRFNTLCHCLLTFGNTKRQNIRNKKFHRINTFLNII